jgi:hypothetical protein
VNLKPKEDKRDLEAEGIILKNESWRKRVLKYELNLF